VKNYWDYYSTMKTAVDKAKTEGRAEGRLEERIANARSLKENGVPLDLIARSLGLTATEIAAL
jgi:predicted transposase/invertase (TIGR01784 family)